jgi:D-glycero-D-manno-heptose 1,7-bisphosphate phosphatase
MDSAAAVFLDRDGVINSDRSDFVKSWQEFRFLPKALDGRRLLAALPVKVVVATNQSGIARGLLTEDCLRQIHKNLLSTVANHGAHIDAIYYCPHLPADRCECRKPKTGMLLRAAQEMKIDLANSWMIGDRAGDIEAARAVGVRPILIRGPRLAEVEQVAGIPGLFLVDDLREAADIIEKFLLEPRPRTSGSVGK